MLFVKQKDKGHIVSLGHHCDGKLYLAADDSTEAVGVIQKV